MSILQKINSKILLLFPRFFTTFSTFDQIISAVQMENSEELDYGNDSKLWLENYSKTRIRRELDPLPLNTPLQPDKVRFVCISDTHELLGDLLPQIPAGDVLLHCGDFTNVGKAKHVLDFNDQLGQLPHPHKIVIAGNHDLGFEDNENMAHRDRRLRHYGTTEGYRLLTNCTAYLCNSMVTVYGINIWGAPWQCLPGWAFYRKRGETINAEWLKIPVAKAERTDQTMATTVGTSTSSANASSASGNAEICTQQPAVDILMTHTPPLGYGDWDYDDWEGGMEGGIRHLGCAKLLECIEQRINIPRYNVFGHIHPAHGVYTNDRGTTFINAAIVNNEVEIEYPPICFDFPLPAGPEHAQQLAQGRAKLAQNQRQLKGRQQQQ